MYIIQTFQYPTYVTFYTSTQQNGYKNLTQKFYDVFCCQKIVEGNEKIIFQLSKIEKKTLYLVIHCNVHK